MFSPSSWRSWLSIARIFLFSPFSFFFWLWLWLSFLRWQLLLGRSKHFSAHNVTSKWTCSGIRYKKEDIYMYVYPWLYAGHSITTTWQLLPDNGAGSMATAIVVPPTPDFLTDWLTEWCRLQLIFGPARMMTIIFSCCICFEVRLKGSGH